MSAGCATSWISRGPARRSRPSAVLGIACATMPEPARRTVLRTVILYIAIFGITSLALGEGTFLYTRHALARQLDLRIARRMDRLGQTYAAAGQTGLLRAIDAFTDHGARTFGYVLTDARGQRLRRLGDIP